MVSVQWPSETVSSTQPDVFVLQAIMQVDRVVTLIVPVALSQEECPRRHSVRRVALHGHIILLGVPVARNRVQGLSVAFWEGEVE